MKHIQNYFDNVPENLKGKYPKMPWNWNWLKLGSKTFTLKLLAKKLDKAADPTILNQAY